MTTHRLFNHPTSQWLLPDISKMGEVVDVGSNTCQGSCGSNKTEIIRIRLLQLPSPQRTQVVALDFSETNFPSVNVMCLHQADILKFSYFQLLA